MSFALERDEKVSHGVRRIARHQLDDMLGELRAGPGRRHAVHEARKRSKKLRALVGLVRDALGDERYRKENGTLRDAVRPLAPMRDAEALVHSLDVLAARFADELRPRAFRRLRRVLAGRTRAARREPGMRAAMRHAAAAVAGTRVARATVHRDGWAALDRGLRRIYARARAAGRCATDDPSVERLHEWRKRAKDLRHALELLEPLWPPVMKTLADQAHDLTDALGDDHDLALLERFALDEPEACGTPEDRLALLGLIDAHRGELLDQARRLGGRLFVEKPRAFVGRLHRYWTAWRDGEGDDASSSADHPHPPARSAA